MKDFGVPPRFPENSTKLDDAKKVRIVLCDVYCNDLRLMVFPAFDVYPSKLCTHAACKLAQMYAVQLHSCSTLTACSNEC